MIVKEASYPFLERLFLLQITDGAGSVDFFFSSRRRHTIFSRDWSSDVCSSDLLITFPFNLIFGSPCSLTSALLLVSNDTFDFPFFLSFDEIWWRMREIWSMNIVFFIRRKQSRMEGMKHFPFLRQFRSICDRSELLQHLEWSFTLHLYLLIIRERKVGSF